MGVDWRADLRWVAALVVLNVASGVPYDYLYVTVLHRATHPSFVYAFPWLTAISLPLALVVGAVVIVARRIALHAWPNWSRVVLAVFVAWTVALHSWAILRIAGARLS